MLKIVVGKNYCWKSEINSSKKTKNRNRNQILTPNKLLTRLWVLQVKAGNNS